MRVKRHAEEILLDSDGEDSEAKRRPLRPIRGNIEDRKTIRRMSQSRDSQDSVQSVHSPMGILEPNADRVLNLMPNVRYEHFVSYRKALSMQRREMMRRRLAAELKSNWQRHVEKKSFTEEEVRCLFDDVACVKLNARFQIDSAAAALEYKIYREARSSLNYNSTITKAMHKMRDAALRSERYDPPV